MLDNPDSCRSRLLFVLLRPQAEQPLKHPDRLPVVEHPKLRSVQVQFAPPLLLLPTPTPTSNRLTHHRCSQSRPQGRRQLNVSRNHDVHSLIGETARAALVLWREPDVQVVSTCSVMTSSLNVEHHEHLFLALRCACCRGRTRSRRYSTLVTYLAIHRAVRLEVCCARIPEPRA